MMRYVELLRVMRDRLLGLRQRARAGLLQVRGEPYSVRLLLN